VSALFDTRDGRSGGKMFVSIRKYDGAGLLTEIDRLARDEFVPILRSQVGFISYSIVDVGNGSVASISTFETRKHADEANRSAREAVQRVFKSLLPNPPTVIMGEVVSHSGK
jgi:hypothetical protein